MPNRLPAIKNAHNVKSFPDLHALVLLYRKHCTAEIAADDFSRHFVKLVIWLELLNYYRHCQTGDETACWKHYVETVFRRSRGLTVASKFFFELLTNEIEAASNTLATLRHIRWDDR